MTRQDLITEYNNNKKIYGENYKLFTKQDQIKIFKMIKTADLTFKTIGIDQVAIANRCLNEILAAVGAK